MVAGLLVEVGELWLHNEIKLLDPSTERRVVGGVCHIRPCDLSKSASSATDPSEPARQWGSAYQI